MKKIGLPIRKCILKKFPDGSITQWFGENDKLYSDMCTIWDGKKVCLAGHNGIDIVSFYGDDILAVEDCIVTETKNDSDGYGRHIRTLSKEADKDGLKLECVYGHLSQINVKLYQEVKKGEVIGKMGNCFDKETEILTDEGWKKFCDLTKREMVATLNPETQEIEYHKPFSYTKKKERFINYYRNYHSLDLAVTDDHTMYVELQDGKMHLKKYKDLPKYSWVKQVGGIWNGIEIDNIKIPKIKYRFSGERSEIKIEADIWLAFLGWFITDGSICNGNSVRITQSFNNQHKRLIIEEILDQLPFRIKRYKEDYIIYSKQLADYLMQLCPNKKIPKFIFDLSPRQIRIFLDSFWLGDGWKHKTTKYYITPDKDSADGLQELIMKCGGYAVIQKKDPLLVNRKKPAMIGGQEIISKKPYYVITEGQHRMAMIKKNMAERKEYNDYAYCLTVKNHLIYVRRNGRPMWCGNSGFVVTGQTPFWNVNPYAGCYDDKTEVLTEDGWKLFADWSGEMVATINRENGKLEYQRPTGFVKIKQDSIFRSSGVSYPFDMAITQKHNVLFYTDSRNKKLNLKPLDEITSREVRIPLVAHWEGEKRDFFILPCVEKNSSSKTKYPTGEIKIPMNIWLEFLGWVLSDGSSYYRPEKSRYIVSISQSYSNVEKRKKIAKCLDAMPFRYWISRGKKSGGVNFVIHNKQLAKYIHELGSGKNKVIPDFVEKLSREQIQIFIDAFALGDGYRKGGSLELYPGLAKKMADQLQILLQKSGKHSVVKTKKTKNGSVVYTVSVHRASRGTLRGYSIKKEKYSGFVFCLQVPNSTLYVRRNGKPYFSGNTHLHFGIRQSKKGQILNWPGKYLGSIDPLPLFETPEPATQPTAEEIEVAKKVSLMKTVIELATRLIELLKVRK